MNKKLIIGLLCMQPVVMMSMDNPAVFVSHVGTAAVQRASQEKKRESALTNPIPIKQRKNSSPDLSPCMYFAFGLGERPHFGNSFSPDTYSKR